MDKALKARRKWRVLAIFSLISIVLGTPLLALAALKGVYAAVVLLVLLVGHGFWGAPFYFLALHRMKVRITMISLITEQGVTDVASLAEMTGLKEEATEQYLCDLAKRGYVSILTEEKQDRSKEES